jgi:recombinational DNA repair protein RecT
MVQGIVKKIMQSGEIATISSHVIYENDRFRFWVDQNGDQVLFEPDLFNPNRGQAIGVFAIAKFKDTGELKIEPMPKEEVMKVKAASPSAGSNYSPWNGPFELEMWRKTAIRRLSKTLPMNTETRQLLEKDVDGDISSMENKPKTKIDELKDKLRNSNQAIELSMDDINAAETIEVESNPVDPNGTFAKEMGE